jgi:hypothetical protein
MPLLKQKLLLVAARIPLNLPLQGLEVRQAGRHPATALTFANEDGKVKW